MAPRVAYSQPQAGPQGFARTKKVFGGQVSLATTDLVTTAQTAIMRVPAGFVVTNIYALASDMDSNGTPTLAFNLGDSGSAARLCQRLPSVRPAPRPHHWLRPGFTTSSPLTPTSSCSRPPTPRRLLQAL